MKKKYLLLMFYICLLAVACSFSWMQMVDKTPQGKTAGLKYGDGSEYKISVEGSDLDVQLFMTDKDGNEIEKIDTVNPLSFEKAVPSTMIYFKLRFTNKTNSSMMVNIFLTEMNIKRNGVLLSGEEAIAKLSGFYAMLNKFDYPETFYSVPKTKFECIGTNSRLLDSGNYIYTFLESLTIPASTKTVVNGETTYSYIDLYCAVYFERTSTIEDFSNVDFNIGKILIIQ